MFIHAKAVQLLRKKVYNSKKEKTKIKHFYSIENYGKSLLIKIHGENKTHPNKKADSNFSAATILS